MLLVLDISMEHSGTLNSVDKQVIEAIFFSVPNEVLGKKNRRLVKIIK